MKTATKYYTPKEVALMFSIQKDTLLFYDKIGLFQPDLRKPNGYRFYSAGQLAELDAILNLRELGFSLPAIGQAMEGQSVDSFLDVMDKERGAVEAKIDALKTRLTVIGEISMRIRDAVSKEAGKLYVGSFASSPVVTVKVDTTGGYTTNDAWDKAYDELARKAGRMNICAIGSIIPLEEAQRGNPFFVRELYAVSARRCRKTIAAGRYAYTYFRGPYVDVEKHYADFLRQISEAHLVPAGDIYEELSVNIPATRKEEDFITQIRVALMD